MASGQLNINKNDINRNNAKKLHLSANGNEKTKNHLPFLIGELALDGRLNAVNGVLPLVLFARSKGYRDVIVAEENAAEAAAVRDLNVFSARHLLAVTRHMDGSKPLSITEPSIMVGSIPAPMPDMADIRGQQQARRVLEIAASGTHHLLMTGFPPALEKACCPATAGYLASTDYGTGTGCYSYLQHFR